jgi:hypothetical protein
VAALVYDRCSGRVRFSNCANESTWQRILASDPEIDRSFALAATFASHRHGSAFVVGYVLSGAIRSKVDNEKEQVSTPVRVGQRNPALTI